MKSGPVLTGFVAAMGVMLLSHATGLVVVVRARRRLGERIGAVQIPFELYPVPRRLREAVIATGVASAPETVVALWSAGSLAAVVLAAVAAGPGMAVVACAVAVLGGLAALRLWRHRRRDLGDRALAAVLEAMARSLRAGSSMTQALRDVESGTLGAPIGDDLRWLVAMIDRGCSLDDAFDRWAASAASTPRHLAATALGLAARTGGAPARLIDSVAATLREREHLEREARALSTQARASAAVMAAAPFVFAVMAAMIDPGVMDFLVHSSAGLACVVVGLLLEGAGGWWMSRLVGARP